MYVREVAVGGLNNAHRVNKSPYSRDWRGVHLASVFSSGLNMKRNATGLGFRLKDGGKKMFWGKSDNHSTRLLIMSLLGEA